MTAHRESAAGIEVSDGRVEATNAAVEIRSRIRAVLAGVDSWKGSRSSQRELEALDELERLARDLIETCRAAQELASPTAKA